MDDRIQWLTRRRSIRRYRPDPIPQEMIDQLITGATWAPSAHNRQPWRFAVITNAEMKHRLSTAMGQRLRADLEADGAPSSLVDRDVGRSYERITGAPLLILLCLSMAEMDRYPDANRQHNEWVMAIQSVAMAGQNLLLAAFSLGLGACWMCAPLFCPDVVIETLNLPTDWEPQALITVGYPDETREKTRSSLDVRVRYIK